MDGCSMEYWFINSLETCNRLVYEELHVGISQKKQPKLRNYGQPNMSKLLTG